MSHLFRQNSRVRQTFSQNSQHHFHDNADHDTVDEDQ